MFGYSNPTLKEYIGIPFGFGLLALAIARNFPSPEANAFYAMAIINCVIIPVVFLIRQFTQNAESDEPDAPKKVQVDKLNIPNLSYAQVSTGVKIDSIRLFNRRILMQKHEGFKVDLTEGYWIKKGEWQKIGGAGKRDWSDMIARGIKHGVYIEKGLQHKRVVADWNKVRRLERGEQLPL